MGFTLCVLHYYAESHAPLLLLQMLVCLSVCACFSYGCAVQICWTDRDAVWGL